MKTQLNLFSDSSRLTEKDAIDLTKASLLAYAERYNHWQISFSGGKDSTALLTIILHLLDTGEIPKPKTLTVTYADTRLELPLLQLNASVMEQAVISRGYSFKRVLAPLDHRFLVYLIGRGVPPPNNTSLRWCTQRIKIDPMIAEMYDLYQETSEKYLSMNGVRLGESAIRDARIYISCNKDGSECGLGHFERTTPSEIADKLSPILHWRLCHIWDWLIYDCPELGFDTSYLIDAYGGDQAPSLELRTGCIGCPLNSKDSALELMVSNPKYVYLSPLKRIRELWDESRKHNHRHRKIDERNKDGKLSSSPSRIGPLTLKWRSHLLSEIIAIQNEVNQEAKAKGYPLIDILNTEEITRIQELIELKTFPNKWDGSEPTGDKLVPQWTQSGVMQDILFTL